MKNIFKILVLVTVFLTSCKNESEDKSSRVASFNVPIDQTLEQLLKQEDTDGDKKITIEDQSPKVFNLESDSGNIFKINGTFKLSNLLQELVLAKNEGKTIATEYFRFTEVFVIIGLYYLGLVTIAIFILKKIEQRLYVPGFGQG